jgi:hypothetical protein
MAYCTEAEVRDENNKLESTVDVISAKIVSRIATAEIQIKADLSPVVSADDLDTIGATNAILNRMAINKTVELCLVKYYGITGKVDERNDVSYFKKEYEKMRDAILNGTLELSTPTEQLTSKSYPAASGSTSKLYSRKGIPGFQGDNQSGNYSDCIDD